MKWTLEQREAGSKVVAAIACLPEYQVGNGKTSYGSIAITIACQRNELLEALKDVRPLIWDDIKRGHGLFGDAHLAQVDAAIDKAEGK